MHLFILHSIHLCNKLDWTPNQVQHSQCALVLIPILEGAVLQFLCLGHLEKGVPHAATEQQVAIEVPQEIVPLLHSWVLG